MPLSTRTTIYVQREFSALTAIIKTAVGQGAPPAKAKIYVRYVDLSTYDNIGLQPTW
jgi:hypothetical protein